MTTTILRLPSVKTRTGLSRSSIYLRISEGVFPRPVSLGSRAVGWRESDIENWVASRVKTTAARERMAAIRPSLEKPGAAS